MYSPVEHHRSWRQNVPCRISTAVARHSKWNNTDFWSKRFQVSQSLTLVTKFDQQSFYRYCVIQKGHKSMFLYTWARHYTSAMLLWKNSTRALPFSPATYCRDTETWRWTGTWLSSVIFCIRNSDGYKDDSVRWGLQKLEKTQNTNYQNVKIYTASPLQEYLYFIHKLTPGNFHFQEFELFISWA